ncbi:hypothetical protein ANCCAN_09669 [Ancylostoma caninum]|uniref:Transthyretin-like family protein n=1 Tax=Ancylostoma caninum TaxID=29170 RepID=A0A368GMW2_ANCCA|nr:hypothetical protein ANCCAN_09669 [Ancylostoma caninum]
MQFFTIHNYRTVKVDMWHLFAFLACLNVVHAHVQCTCPERKPGDPEPDFVITAKVVREEVDDDGTARYEINGTRILQPTRPGSFSTTLHTKGDNAIVFAGKLVARSRYLIEGKFNGNGQQVITGCELLGGCQEDELKEPR